MCVIFYFVVKRYLQTNTVSVLVGASESVGVRAKGVWVHHSLVKYESILFSAGYYTQLFRGRVPREKVRVDNIDETSGVLGICQL